MRVKPKPCPNCGSKYVEMWTKFFGGNGFEVRCLDCGYIGELGKTRAAAVGGKVVSRETKIDWADSAWNPVTGCRHNCEYCYARKIARRFGGVYYEDELPNRWGEYECVRLHADGDLHELDYPLKNYGNNKIAPYPFEFDPTFYRYKLEEPKR